jgi:hypothetical protein
MQPRNPYQGQPTSNMDFPTEAYMAAAANAARIQADAQAKLGEQIGAGIQKLGSAVGNYMSEKADYEASSKLLESPSFRQAMGLSQDDVDQQKTILKKLVGDGGYKAANAYAKQQIDSLINYHTASRAFEMQKQLVGARAEAEAGLIAKRQANEVINQAADFTNKQKAYTFQTDEQIRLEREKAKLRATTGIPYNPSVVEKPEFQ